MVQSASPIASAAEWQQFARAHPDLEALDAFIIDVNGNTAGKRLAIADAHKVFTEGVQFSSCALIADVRGLGHNVQGMGASDGDPDGTAMPLSGTLHRVPWAKSPTAQVLCSMRHCETHQALWFDPRVLLAEVVAQCRKAGVHPVVACELEFYLLDPRRGADGGIALAALPGRGPPRRAANLSMDALEDSSDFLNSVASAAAEQNVPVCGAVAEYGIGQYEVNLRHVADPVLAADHAVLLKRIVKESRSRWACWHRSWPSPLQDSPAAACMFTSASSMIRVAIALVQKAASSSCSRRSPGMQALMFDSVGFCAPNFNSYRRYLGPFVPTTRDWGHNNRSVAFRVPAARGSGRRVEHRVAGADASPHIVVAAVLASALHGMTHGLVATAPAEGRVESKADGAFPNGVLAALDRLEQSSLMRQYIPARFLALFAELKRKEYAAFIEGLFTQEFDFYL